MWKRDQAVKSANSQPTTPADSGQQTPASVESTRMAETKGRHTGMANIGKSILIKGELYGSEDLTIDGRIEGKIELKDHVVTIGPSGEIQAEVHAKSVIVQGTVDGNLTASDKVEIREGGSVNGDLAAPTVAIAEGASFRGSVDMQKKGPRPLQSQPGISGQPNKPPQPAVAAAPKPPGVDAPVH